MHERRGQNVIIDEHILPHVIDRAHRRGTKLSNDQLARSAPISWDVKVLPC